jgi:hypothetical protein
MGNVSVEMMESNIQCAREDEAQSFLETRLRRRQDELERAERSVEGAQKALAALKEKISTLGAVKAAQSEGL